MRKYDDFAPKTVWKRICFLLDPFLSVVQNEATKRGQPTSRPEIGINFLERVTGFEPTSPRRVAALETGGSIQLSYTRLVNAPL